ncbi:hypothetical protein [Polyangium aurulentum]|uniref:hypothetical protein n=1 Tax=Polyangium aurulentum TaxID=2567896 RepID=UPI0010AE3A37|nr:hypothetical protein [Polyangium aurulentum]UQA59494.1 hypothetical protein E8A73_002995 [Polyangium aurulentum]
MAAARPPSWFALDAPFDILPEIARFEPPDIVVFHPVRPLTAESAEQILAFMRDAASRTGGLFTASDVSGPVVQLSMSTSLEFNRRFDRSMIRAAAVIGASYRMRILAESLVRAARLLRLEVASSPIRYFDDLTTARAWFDEIRQQRA